MASPINILVIGGESRPLFVDSLSHADQVGHVTYIPGNRMVTAADLEERKYDLVVVITATIFYHETIILLSQQQSHPKIIVATYYPFKQQFADSFSYKLRNVTNLRYVCRFAAPFGIARKILQMYF